MILVAFVLLCLFFVIRTAVSSAMGDYFPNQRCRREQISPKAMLISACVVVVLFPLLVSVAKLIVQSQQMRLLP